MVSAVTNGKRAIEIWAANQASIGLLNVSVADAKRHVILLSGPWEHPALLAPLADALARLGCSSSSPVLPIDGGVTFARWIELVCALCDRTRQRHPSARITLMGVGLGGTLAYWAAAAGASNDDLFVTALGDPRRAALRARVLGTHWPSALTTLGMQWLVPAWGRRAWTPRGVLDRDLTVGSNTAHIGITDETQASPLLTASEGSAAPSGRELPLSLVASWLTTTPAVEPEAFTRCPVVLAAPTADRWLQLEPSLDFYRRLPAEKQLHMLADVGHLPVDAAGVEAVTLALRASLAWLS